MDRDTPMTFAPAFRNDSVTNVPSPPLAPVTIVILPSSAFILNPYSPDDHATRNSGYSVRPPHAKMVCPVTYEASSDARNANTEAISSAAAACPTGMWLSTSPRALGLSIQARLIGVTTAPGPTAFTRIPWPAYSNANDLVRFSIPPLLME